jgi:hypothetical protein
MSWQVRSINLLKVVNSNNITTSLVEVPCSAKQSGFKKQSWKRGWVEQILYNVRKNRQIELLVDAADGDKYLNKEDDKRAYTNAGAARWLMTYLGECFPAEFVKTCQSTRGRWMPKHACELPVLKM